MALIKNANFYPDFIKLLINNGLPNGILTVSTTTGLHVKQKVVLYDNINTPFLLLEIIEVISTTQIVVGLYDPTKSTGNAPLATQDCSAFLTANGAALRSYPEQKSIPERDNPVLAAYETAPVEALRVMNVDAQGNYSNTVTIAMTPPISSLTEIAPQYGIKTAAQVLGTNAITATAIFTLNADRSILQVANNLDQSVSITYAGIECWRLESGNDSFILDFRTNSLKLGVGTVIGVFYHATAPTTGTIRVTAT